MNTVWARLLVAELVRNGVNYFCISPGSRSTPLVIAAAEQENARCLTHFDERGAAFQALGYARATGKPAVLICTSGTAVANYLPAVIEASTDHIPLIILSADRPEELQATGANQTIEQAGLFGQYVRFAHNFPCPTDHVPARYLLTTIDQAVYRACSAPAGPVHLNCPFREPLITPDEDQPMDDFLSDLGSWQNSDAPFTDYGLSHSTMDEKQLQGLAAFLNQEEKGLLVVGRLGNDNEREAVLRLIRKLQWPVLPDIASGLRLGRDNDWIVPYFDLILLALFNSLADKSSVVHIGGQLTSKRLQQFLDSDRFENHIRIANHPCRHDPGHRLTSRIDADLVETCYTLSALIDKEADTLPQSIAKQIKAVDKIVGDMTSQGDLTEPTVARLISKHIIDSGALWLGSSLPIRELDTFAACDGPAVPVGCNRGVSGIDGTIASAIGFARGLEKSTTALVGDLTMLHDLNSLAMVRDLAPPLTIVVLNNHGGGIFSFLPVAEQGEIFEPYFATPHQLTFEAAAKMFGLNYLHPTTPDEFVTMYTKAQRGLGKERSTIIEVSTDRQENFNLHREIASVVSSVLDEL